MEYFSYYYEVGYNFDPVAKPCNFQPTHIFLLGNFCYLNLGLIVLNFDTSHCKIFLFDIAYDTTKLIIL